MAIETVPQALSEPVARTPPVPAGSHARRARNKRDYVPVIRRICSQIARQAGTQPDDPLLLACGDAVLDELFATGTAPAGFSQNLYRTRIHRLYRELRASSPRPSARTTR